MIEQAIAQLTAEFLQYMTTTNKCIKDLTDAMYLMKDRIEKLEEKLDDKH